MSKISAGIVLFRINNERLEVLLGHPGGPLWKNKDFGAWSIPKGEIIESEDVFKAACREFKEETGIEALEPFYPLGKIKQKSGKIIHAWASEGDCEPKNLKSNTFSLEWPPHSKNIQSYPEIDFFDFFSIKDAKIKINPMQMFLIEKLNEIYPKEYAKSNEDK